MGVFSAFSLPIQGLKVGIHEYQYTLDASFFKLFEDSLIGESELVVSVALDKRYDMMILDFEMEGWIQSDCDRCSASIHLPISSEQTLFVKYSEEKEEEEDEVIFIHREAPELNLAKYLYEFVVLSLPISSTYDCEKEDPRPCNMEVLALLNSSNEDKDDSSGSSVWDVLKDLK
jgi:uncharacterized protein